MEQFATLNLALGAPISRITLSNPERLNALSPQMLGELIAAAETVARSSGVKVVIVAGAGRAFCAGFALDAVSAQPTAELVDQGRRMAEAVGGIPALTIAAIHGHCVGGGIVLAAACDIRLAAGSTRFAIPEVDLGIPLAWGGIPRLVRELGPALTKELVLSCRSFTAGEAHAMRFVNRVVPDGDLDAEVQAMADSVASRSAYLIQHTKRHVDAVVEDAYPTHQSFRDAEATIAAAQDQESRAAMQRYLTAHGHHAPPN